MMRGCIIGIAAAALSAPAIALAQGGGVVVVPQATTIAPAQAGGTGGRVVAGAETKITTGRPYSGEAVTETTQVLGDGNRINRKSTTRVYRDGEGRTRREMLAEDGTVRSISISDPVARRSYTLDPKTKVAYTGSNMLIASRTPTGTYTMTTQGGATSTVSTAKVAEAGQAISGFGVGGGGGRGGGAMMRSPAPDNPNVTKEELAPQNIEGVMAAGTRTTTVIPAGEIGNAQELRVISEQWFSDELQVLVMTRHSDPRSGETIYRLRNILRAEPDPSLFAVPADYTIQQRGIRKPE